MTAAATARSPGAHDIKTRTNGAPARDFPEVSERRKALPPIRVRKGNCPVHGITINAASGRCLWCEHPELAAQEFRRRAIKRSRMAGKPRDFFAPALRFMRENVRKAPSLRQIAWTVRLSPFHFAREFRKTLGIAPHRALAILQVEEAANLMLAGLPLAHVAVDCGFAHQAAFTKRFHQATGLPPGRWLRERKVAKKNFFASKLSKDGFRKRCAM